jgi:hypothetical protein
MRLESTEDWVIGVLPLIVACLLLLDRVQKILLREDWGSWSNLQTIHEKVDDVIWA